MRKTSRSIARAAVAAALVTFSVASLALAAPGAARPSDPPPPLGGPGKGDAGPTVNDPRGDKLLSEARLGIAVDELLKEYSDFAANPRAALREHSNYFIQRPVQLHQGALVAAMEKVSGNNARLIAYVRWQLLSGGPKDGAWEKDLVPRVAELYRRAPVPLARYGLSAADQRKLDALLTSTKKDEAMRLNDLIDDRIGKDEDANRLVFAYRDALYASLPMGYDRFSGGLRDAFERLGYGWPPKDLMKRVDDEMTAWANSGAAADARQYTALAQTVFRLRSERTPRYYVAVGTSRTTKQPYWMTRTDALHEAKKLADLQKLLEDKAGVRRPSIDGAAATRK